MQFIEESRDSKTNNLINKTKKEEDLLITSSNLNTINNAFENPNTDNSDCPPPRDVGTDTNDLILENNLNFENKKENDLNKIISWSFLKRLSDMNQWPLGCLGNFIENSFKKEVDSKNVLIDVRAYNKYVYIGIERYYPEIINESFLKKKYSKCEGLLISQVQ